MFGRKASASNVLDRATHQLRGERVPSRNSTEEDELQAYLSQVAKKTAGTSSSKENKKIINVPDGSDISISEDDFKFIKKDKSKDSKSGPGKYLKSKPKHEAAAPVSNVAQTPQPQIGFRKNSSNLTALSKAAALTHAIQNQPRPKSAVSDSDFDITISTDDSVLKELNMPKPQERPKTSHSQGRPKTSHSSGRPTSASPSQKPQESPGKPKLSKQNPASSVPWSQSFDKSDDDVSLGKGGRRFLKKKPTRGTENMTSSQHVASSGSMTDGGSPGTKKKLRFDLKGQKPSSPERRGTEQPLKPALKTSSSFRSSQEDEEVVVNVASSNSSLNSDIRIGRGNRRYVKKPSADVLKIADDTESIQSDDSYKVNLVMDIEAANPSYTVLHPLPESPKSPGRPKTGHGRKSPTRRDSNRPKTPPKSPSPDPFKKSRKSPSPEKRPSSPEKRRKQRTPSPDMKRKSPSPDPFRSSIRRSSSEDLAASKKGPNEQKRVKSPDQKRKKQQKKQEDDFFSSMGLQTVDDLLGNKSESEVSEVAAKPKKKSSKTKAKPKEEADDYLHSFGLQTIEDLLGAAPAQSEEDEESISMEIPFKSDHSEIVSDYDFKLGEKRKDTFKKQDSVAYTEDFESSTSEIVTMQSGRTPRQYSEDFESETVTESETETLKDEEDSQSSYFTSERSYSSRDSQGSYRSVEIVRRRSVTAVEVEVQTSEAGLGGMGGMGGLGYQWNQAMGQAYANQAYGLGFTDPTPIATHTVSADALEAVTAYSPCVLALNDMLRQQLALTQQFIANQNRVYQSLVSSVTTDHQYTTLEGTKRYIEEHRRPRLTFDQALSMVRDEMEQR